VLITFKDQIMMPLVQGIVFQVVMSGWRAWGRGVRESGRGIGGRCSVSSSKRDS
jgi:hypothetical protein